MSARTIKIVTITGAVGFLVYQGSQVILGQTNPEAIGAALLALYLALKAPTPVPAPEPPPQS